MVHKFPLQKVVNHGNNDKSFRIRCFIKKTNSHFLSNHEYAANKKLTHVEHQHSRTTQTWRYFCDPAALHCSNQQRRGPSVRGRKLVGRSAFWRPKERGVGVLDHRCTYRSVRGTALPRRGGIRRFLIAAAGHERENGRRSAPKQRRHLKNNCEPREGRRRAAPECLIGCARGSTVLETEKDVTRKSEG